jgi:VIT1/CCC1 family predicted Fe2+/Mn2+ transporter
LFSFSSSSSFFPFALCSPAIAPRGAPTAVQARPFQAGIVSFLMFLIFGSIPFLSCIFIPNRWALIGVCVGVTLFLLALCGAIGAYFGGASMWKGMTSFLIVHSLHSLLFEL